MTNVQTTSPTRRVETKLEDRKKPDQPLLVFFTRETSGPCRRMQSLVAWIKVTERRRLRVIEVDADRNPELARRFEVKDVPTLVLLRGREIVGRIEGRTTGHDIESMIRAHLPART